ncbi:MAG: hypothetical protein ACOZNI_01140 [Myxococcota bacterium]
MDIEAWLRAYVDDVDVGARAVVGALAFDGDVRAWCLHERLPVRRHVRAAAVVLGQRLPRVVEAAGGSPDLLGRIAGLANGKERDAVIGAQARWLVLHGDVEARRAWVRGAAATDPRPEPADALRHEIARAMAVAEIELFADVAHCVRLGLRPAQLHKYAATPNLSGLLARSSSFADLERRIKAGRRPDRTVQVHILQTTEEVRYDSDAGTLSPAGAESDDEDPDLSL